METGFETGDYLGMREAELSVRARGLFIIGHFTFLSRHLI
jgi:hypothetical protein